MALVAVVIGAFAGLASGLLGVGGGILIVPLLVSFAGLTQHEAHATSLAAIVPIAAVGATRFALDSSVDLPLAALLTVGSFAGAPLGAKLMVRSKEATLKLLFGVLIMAVAVQLLWP
jgi:hypothetical protein